MVTIIGFIIEGIAIIFSLFFPVLYTQDWEYGKVSGIGKVYNNGSKTMYDLFSLYGVWYIVFSIVIISTLVLLIILYKKKMLNIYVSIPFMFLWLVPIVFMFIGKNILKSEGKFIGNNLATYGSGTSAGFSGYGFILIILIIVSISLILFDEFRMKERKDKIIRQKTVKNIKLKKEKDIKLDDFKM